MERLQATIVTDEDITSPALLATYTALAAATWQVTVSLSGLAGNGVYKAATRRQVEGAGAVYQSPTAFLPLAVGVSTGTLTTIPLPVNVDDVVEVWAEGLAGDVAVDGVVELFDVTAAANGATAAELLAAAYEGTETLEEFLRLARAVLLGEATVSSGQVVYKSADGDTARVTATHDRQGNRSAVTVDAS